MKTVYLDIKTKQLPFGNIPMRDIKLAVAGTLFEGHFKTYEEKDVDLLVSDLKQYDRIVGHNVFSFGYAILGNYFQYPEVALGAKYSGLRGKTFDTMMAFADIVGSGVRSGNLMALDNMCSHSFGMTKPFEGKLIPQMWKDGKHDEVKAYLLNDLRMTEKFYLAGCQGTKIKYDHKIYGKSQGEREIYLKW
jgi:hypothetical protein